MLKSLLDCKCHAEDDCRGRIHLMDIVVFSASSNPTIDTFLSYSYGISCRVPGRTLATQMEQVSAPSYCADVVTTIQSRHQPTGYLCATAEVR